MHLINVNCRSILSKKSDLLHLITTTNPDIIVATETWLDSSITNNEVIPEEYNYKIYRKDRSDGYGGVLLAISGCLQSFPVPELDSTAEMVWARISTQGCKDLYVSSYYRPHTSDMSSLEQLENVLNKLRVSNKQPLIWIAGDFNAPYINWESLSLLEGSSHLNTHEKLLDILMDHSLSQMVHIPTRGRNILDLFITNSPSLITLVDTIPGVSDHEIVTVQSNVRLSVTKQIPRRILCYSKADWDSILHELEDFQSNLNNVDPYHADTESLWTMFRDKLSSLVDQYIPSRNSRRSRDLPWLTPLLRRKIRHKNKLYQQYKRLGGTYYYNRFLTLKHSIQKDMRKSYWSYIDNLISLDPHSSDFEVSNNSSTIQLKKFWSYIKAIKKDCTSISSLIHNDNLLTETSAKAEALNAQFSSVFTNECLNEFPDKGPSPYSTLPDLHITTEGICNLLANLNVHKAAGPDFITARILKETCHVVAPILKTIFCSSLLTGVVPCDWRSANVIPIYKNGNRQNPGNYRPISLTSLVSKIFEKIVAFHITNYLECDNIFYDLQHGFRRYRSCETQLSSLVHDLMANFDHGIQTDLVLMDLSKAFDRVPHERLLYKLHWYGVRGHLHRWIRAFLMGRTQQVVLDGATSSTVPVASGVPQGSVLGPLLFIVYINDLQEYTKHCTVRLFADDCVLYRPIFDYNDTLLVQEDLSSLQNWSQDWLMCFNASKCHSMSVTLSRNAIDATYYLNGTPLSVVDHCKYLGVIIQSDLNWNKHVEQKVSKASSMLGLIHRNLKTSSTKTKELAYKTLVRPHLEYASIVWSPWQQSLVKMIEKTQRRAARFVLNDYSYNSSVTNMLSRLQWDSLELRRKKSRLCMFYKSIFDLVAFPICDYVLPSGILSTRGSHPFKIQPIFANKNSYKQSFLPSTIPIWNSLPDNVVESPSLQLFKLNLNNYLFK